MKLSEFKKIIANLGEINIQLENGESVPSHFHLTELGVNTRHFIDCGGTERIEKKVNLQLWVAEDFDHRLTPEKLQKIVNIGESILGLGDWEIEVEFQRETIGKFYLDFENNKFILKSTITDCLAKDSCGIPTEKTKVKLSDLKSNEESCCTPSSGCC